MENILLEFCEKCNKTSVSKSEMYNFIKSYTNLDKTSIEYLRNDLNNYVNNIKFFVYIETKNQNINELFEFDTDNGTVYCYESPRTVYSYIKDAFPELDMFLILSTPRQKIQFIVNDRKEKYISWEIFEDKINGFLLFSDLVEVEYEKINKTTPEAPETKDNQKKTGRKLEAKYTTFESMFIDETMPLKVINELIDYETLNPKGELIKDKYYILAITEALQILGIINKDVSKTNRNNLFATKFNTVISDKTTRTKGNDYDYLLSEYKSLFNRLLLS